MKITVRRENMRGTEVDRLRAENAQLLEALEAYVPSVPPHPDMPDCRCRDCKGRIALRAARPESALRYECDTCPFTSADEADAMAHTRQTDHFVRAARPEVKDGK